MDTIRRLPFFSALTTAAALLFAGCSRDLSRGQAADLISKAISQTAADYHLFKEYRSSIFAGPANWLGNNNKQTCERLAADGYITLNATPQVISVGLTDKGSKLFAESQLVMNMGQPIPCWNTPVCRMEVVDVTGISKADQNTAVVQYTWHWKLSPLGRILWASAPEVSGAELGSIPRNPDAVSTGEAMFSRFDDGWRITN